MSRSLIKHSHQMLLGKSVGRYLGYRNGPNQKLSFLKPTMSISSMQFSTEAGEKEPLVKISHIEGTKVANLILNRPPINSLNLEL